MQIHEVCKENRKMLELTIEEFAESIDVDPKLYKKFEDGEFLFSNDIMKRIVSSLYIDKEDLYKEFIEDDITRISMKVIEECEKSE